MTNPYYIERGVEREITSVCLECMHRKTIHAGDITAVIVICENQNSDHYGHVMNGSSHPACKEFETVTLTELGEKNLDER